MSRRVLLLGATILGLPAWALEAPTSIKNARIETRAGTTPAAALESVGRGSTPDWVGWSVTAIPEAGDVCCHTNSFKRRGCSLSEKDNSWGTNFDGTPWAHTDVYILAERTSGKVSRVRMFSGSCPVDGANRRLVWLGPVDSGASLAVLGRLLDDGADRDRVDDPALGAIAYHRDTRADELIEKRVLDGALPKEARAQAIFWAGQARGDAGYQLLDRFLASEPSGDLRQNAVFALSQSDVPRAVDRIKRAAVEDKDAGVRAHALFSLTQTKAADSGEWIVSRLDAEKDDHVREQAVFALSQLDDGTDWLLQVLRSTRDPETIRRALFWLGQSKDPRALEEISKILER